MGGPPRNAIRDEIANLRCDWMFRVNPPPPQVRMGSPVSGDWSNRRAGLMGARGDGGGAKRLAGTERGCVLGRLLGKAGRWTA
eukprot:4549160-Pyramimonas_sp.AAC.1